MSARISQITVLALGCGLVLSLATSTSLAAQSAASATYFSPASEVGSGGRCATAAYRLDASFGAGVVPTAAFSSTYRLIGGFEAAASASTTGQCWLAGVVPAYAPLLGGVSVALHGHELDLATGVTIGGVAGSITSRTKDRMIVSLPAQPAPGCRPVVVSNGSKSSSLPNGIGILPMADKFPAAIENTEPFEVKYRGTPGDTVYIAVASGLLGRPFKVPPYRHGLLLNPALHIDTIGPLPVVSPSGVLTLKFPAINFPRPLYVQMLGIPAANPGYAPGSLTNVISL